MDGNNATEQAAAEFDDTEIKCLLLGDENERQKAGDELFQSFNHRLMGKLREFFWLSEDEKDRSSMIQSLRCSGWLKEATLDVERPLVGLLLRICRFKAIDLSRHKRRKAGWDGESGKDEELTEDIAEALVDTKVGLAWKHATSNEDAPAIRKEFLTFIQSLPAQQKLVGGILADNSGVQFVPGRNRQQNLRVHWKDRQQNSHKRRFESDSAKVQSGAKT